MLEIIILIYLARRTRGIVEPKGYNSGKWQAYAVLLWIVIEIFAVVLFTGFLGADTIIAIISAYLCAIGASIALQKYAENLPDLNKGTEDWINNMGNDQYNQ
jgi:hypothetical protein